MTDRKKWTSVASRKRGLFLVLEEELCNAHTLGYMQPGEMFIIDTDTSSIGITEYSPKYRMSRNEQ
jgi:hypothetical protein